MNDRKTHTSMTGLQRAHEKMIVLSFRDQLRGGHLEPALSALTTGEDGAIDGARLADSERDRAAGGHPPGVPDTRVLSHLLAITCPHPRGYERHS